MNLKDKASGFVLEKAVNYISGNPKENLPKLLKWADDFDLAGNWKEQRELFHKIIDDPENVWNQYIISLYNDIDETVLQTTFKNFLIKASMLGYPKQRKMEKKLDSYLGLYSWIRLQHATCNAPDAGQQNMGIS